MPRRHARRPRVHTSRGLRRRRAATALVAVAAVLVPTAAVWLAWGPVSSAIGLADDDAPPHLSRFPGLDELGATAPAGAAAPPLDAGGADQADAAVDDPADAPTGNDDLDNLDPELRRRFVAAQQAASAAGFALTLTSGWRSPEEQQALVDKALETYGSAAEAHRYVLPPDRSEHVAGRAVDVGDQDAAAWLGEHGAELGLCRTYANEWWHFEAMPADGVCPDLRADSSWGW